MSPKLYILALTLFFQSCCFTTNSPVCNELQDIISDYMNRNDYKIYSLSMLKIDGVDHLTIEGQYAYDKDYTDGFFYTQGKLVVYCFLDKVVRPDIIYQKNTCIFRDTIMGYPEKSNLSANFEPNPQEYCVISPDSIVHSFQVPDSCYHHIDAVDNNVIRDNRLNDFLNNYINTYSAHLYEIYLKKTDASIYAYVSGTFSFDNQLFDGFFFRNGHLVVIYNADLVKDANVFDHEQMLHDTQLLNNYRKVKYRLHYYPYTRKLRIG